MYFYINDNAKCYKKLLNYLLKFEVISFDIFDTTIFRICQKPENVFEYVGEQAGIADFAALRRNAQRQASKKHGVRTDLHAIYDELQILAGFSKEKVDYLQQLEVDVEAFFCRPKKTSISLIEDLSRSGKTVIFSSDMYLRSDNIKYIFEKLGLNMTYDNMFVSCEMTASKSNGDLFKSIEKEYCGKKIVHIGDYWKSDVLNAVRNSKIDAVYYPIFHDDDKYRYWVKNSTSSRKDYIYNWAYQEFAPVLWNFCEWIYTEAIRNGDKNLLFLTREGAFIKQLFDIYNDDQTINAKVFYASRRSLLCASSDINWSWITQTFGAATVGFLLDAFHIDKGNYDAETLNQRVDKWEDLTSVKNDMKKYSCSQRNLLLSYIESLIGKQEKIGLIDVGWKGSSQFFLKKMLESENWKTDVSGYYLGEFFDERHKSLRKKGFLCSANDTNYKEAVLNAGFIFENILSPEFGSTREYKMRDGVVMPVLETNSDEGGSEVKIAQQGLLDYFNDFCCVRNYIIHPQKEETISYLFKHLNSPSLRMAEQLGNISFTDFGHKNYVANPKNAFYYMMHPRSFFYDFKHCGWNSAFCKRCFKLPLPYFAIYKYLRRGLLQ